MNAVTEKFADWRERVADFLPEGNWVKWAAGLVVLYLVLMIILGMYWSLGPSQFDVQDKTASYAAQDSLTPVTGSATAAALMGAVETLLEKPGGYLHNDKFPPGLWLDNVPNWEFGVLVQVRDLARALREVHSRSQSQSTEDKDLALAEPRFNFNSDSWILPSSESQYKQGLTLTHSYFRRLSDEQERNAQFYARADNLRYWLATVNTRLGSLSQRLSASVGQRRINTDLAGDGGATQSTRTATEMYVKTPWTEIDDVFYESRGAAWALIHFLKAAELDFADVLSKKNAQVSLLQIIRELERTQDTVWSPMIVNGSGFGMMANHSLVMASYISRANASIIDLMDLLEQG
jgi:hypothetical protein